MDRIAYITSKLGIIGVAILDLALLSTIFTDIIDAGVKIITLITGIIIAFFVVKRIKAQLRVLELDQKRKELERDIKKRELENMIKDRYGIK